MKMKNRTRESFIRQSCLLTALLLCLQPAAHAHGFISQAQSEVKQLEPGRSVEREIAGGESHTYQITLASGQFMRVLVEQKGIDLTLALATSQGEAGKATAEVNLNRVDLESLSYEATVSGEYRFTVRALGTGTLKGTYQVTLEQRQAATTQDRQRITAERLLGEGYPLYHLPYSVQISALSGHQERNVGNNRIALVSNLEAL